MDLTSLSNDERETLLCELLKLHRNDPNHRFHDCQCIPDFMMMGIDHLVNLTVVPTSVPENICEICHDFVSDEDALIYSCQCMNFRNLPVCKSCNPETYGMRCTGSISDIECPDGNEKPCEFLWCKQCMTQGPPEIECNECGQHLNNPYSGFLGSRSRK
jgi:hypothetical protein